MLSSSNHLRLPIGESMNEDNGLPHLNEPVINWILSKDTCLEDIKIKIVTSFSLFRSQIC